MSKFSIISNDFVDGGEIPKECGYKHGNEEPHIDFIPKLHLIHWAMIMDDPDAMKAVGKVWVHWLEYGNTDGDGTPITEGKNDLGEIGYGGPAPPDGRHTYVFKL